MNQQLVAAGLPPTKTTSEADVNSLYSLNDGDDYEVDFDDSAMEKLKKRDEARKERFGDKLKFWASTRPQPEDIEQQIRVAKKGPHLVKGRVGDANATVVDIFFLQSASILRS